MKKLTGLLVFVVVLAGAIGLTKYYSARDKPAPPPPPDSRPPAPLTPDMPPPAEPGAPSDAPVSFKPKLVTLDFATGKGHTTLELERDPARPAPEKIWVWTYFFTNDAGGERRYCAGEPVERRQPFAIEDRAIVNVSAPVPSCPEPRAASATYYARVNVSAESSFAARLAERQLSYDITRATPVVVQGARPARR